MTSMLMKKQFSAILTTCLIFGSLYLPAYADEPNNTSTPPVIKKSPEALFLEGTNCLKQADLACAKLRLASTPSASPYAKLLQGSIASSEHQVDEVLRLLLPLQADSTLIAEAKVQLHQQLANAFENLDDTLQAIQHLMQADAISHTSSSQPKIWALLNKLDQTQLIAMRGENTDNEFQGWVDLCLAAKNQDKLDSINQWMASYADHPATVFAKQLNHANNNTAPIQLMSEGGIALFAPTLSETNQSKLDAYKLGLQTALNKYGLKNTIHVYTNDASTAASSDLISMAKDEGNTYLVAPHFETESDKLNLNNEAVLNVQLSISDEATRIVKFAKHHAMQHITVITTEDAYAQQLLNQFKTAWQDLFNHNQNSDVNVIVLPHPISSNHVKLLDIKSQIAATPHDMLLLALSTEDVLSIRPYLDISTPTLAFANLNSAKESNTIMSAIRIPEIPLLISDNREAFADYYEATTSLVSTDLIRCFTLGVDTLRILIAKQQKELSETTINGLTGKLSIDQSGNLNRELSIGRITYNGIQAEE